MGRSTYSERLVEAMGSKEIDAIKALAKSAKISYQGAVKLVDGLTKKPQADTMARAAAHLEGQHGLADSWSRPQSASLAAIR